MTIAAPHFWDAVAKISVLERAARGDPLSERDAALLASIAEDYKPHLVIGNMAPITHHDVIEAVKILRDDVRFMAGWRRANTLRLLQRIEARGSRLITPEMISGGRSADHDERLAIDVMPDEIDALDVG